MPQQRMTINDIAKASGVSKTTVSRYLNGKYELMSDKTRARIKAVIEVSHYQPSPIAQSLKSRQSMQIGVVVPDLSSPFFGSMLTGICEVLEKEGYLPLIVNTNSDIHNEEKLVTELLRRGVDGLLVNTAAYDNPFLVDVGNKGMPIVLCDRYIKDYNLDIVTSEIKSPFEQMISHVRQEGFSCPVLFIEPYEHNSTRYLRRKAFLEYAQQYYGRQDAATLVMRIDVQAPDVTARHIRRIIENAQPQTPPVIIGANTVTTMHLLGVVKSLGCRMPLQIGICGADDWSRERRMEWPALVDPGISTFAINAEGIGRKAAELLLERLDNATMEKRRVQMPVKFTARGSTSLKKALPDGTGKRKRISI